MSATAISAPADYLAANENAAIYPIPNPGYLLISGETRREYLQRQTTNDIDLLSPTRVLPTMLTAPTGRILEYYILLEVGDSIAMLTQPGHGPGNAVYFQKRIFFNDKVTIQDQSGDWPQIEVLGPSAPDLLMRLGFPHSPGPDEILEIEWHGAKLSGFGVMSFGSIERFRLIAPSTHINQLSKELNNYPTLSFSSREILRLEASHAGDPELAAETTPFELGMDRLVSTSKGCYTGQEVLARQVTYDKVVRRLVRLRADQLMSAGSSLSVDGKSVGQITSAAISPREGPIALGIVRKPYDERGTSLLAQGENSSVKATVN
jgi:folate-binding protein YgfZ